MIFEGVIGYLERREDLHKKRRLLCREATAGLHSREAVWWSGWLISRTKARRKGQAFFCLCATRRIDIEDFTTQHKRAKQTEPQSNAHHLVSGDISFESAQRRLANHKPVLITKFHASLPQAASSHCNVAIGYNLILYQFSFVCLIIYSKNWRSITLMEHVAKVMKLASKLLQMLDGFACSWPFPFRRAQNQKALFS